MNTKSITKTFLYRVAAIFMIAMMLLAVMPVISAFAIPSGFFSPTRALSNGPGWKNSTYTFSSDDLYATAVRPHKILKLSNFNFTAIQGGATIDGIEITVEGHTLGLQTDVSLYNASSGAYTKGISGVKTTSLGGSDSVINTLGGPTDTWGSTWTSNDFTNANFIVKLTTSGTRGQTISIDQVQVKVYYTLGDSTLTLNPVSGNYGGTTTMTATLTATVGGAPVAGQTVSFSLNGTSAGSAVTDSSGVATLSSVSLVGINAGNYLYGAGASFAGGGGFSATSITADLRVYGTPTMLTVTPSSGTYTGATGTGTTNFAATLTETVSGNPVVGQTVNFYLGSAPAGSGVTNAFGIVSITGTSGLLAGYDAGVYNDEVMAEFTSAGSFEGSTGFAALTVNPVILTVSSSGLTPGNKVYDGNVTASLTVGSPALNAGVISPDDVTLDYSSVVGSFSDKDIGLSKTVQISGLTLTGLDAGNYSLTQPTRQANITAKALMITGLTADSKVYDGNTTATLSGTAALFGVVGSETVTLGGTPVATFANATVGIAKPVTVTGYTISGADVGNYTLTQPTGLTADITAPVYWLPWYNNIDLDTQLRFGNISASTATVHVYIGGVEMSGSPFSLTASGAGQSTRLSFAGVNNGPVKVVSNVSIVVAERVIYNVNGTSTSFSEMKALPDSQLNTAYWMPWYNNVDLDTQLRFGNVSGSTATVHVFIGGAEMTGSPFTLLTGQSTRVSFAGVNNGPVKVVSDVKIVAAERVIYNVNGTPTSFTEMMGLPDSQLNTTYWMPWYNNVDLDTQLRFGNVSGSTATVHVFIGGSEMTGSPFTLLTGQSTRVSFAGVNNGPVKVISDVNIVAAERVIYKVNGTNTSFSEMMGLPNSLLNTTYWMPWYNNVDLDTQLRFGNVSGSTATIHVYIGGVEMTGSPYTLLTGQSTRVSFAGVNTGPVKMVSNVPIVVAERVIYNVNGTSTSFSEMK